MVVGLCPRKNHGTWWQSLFAAKPLAGFHVVVDVVWIFLSLLAPPANPVEVVFFLLLSMRNLASKMIVGGGSQFAQIDADFVDIIRRPHLTFSAKFESPKSLIEPLI